MMLDNLFYIILTFLMYIFALTLPGLIAPVTDRDVVVVVAAVDVVAEAEGCGVGAFGMSSV